jgi:hypothetical protein
MARFRIGCLLLLGVLCGCALWPIPEAECKGVNWRQRGYDDGYGGHPRQDLRLAKECRRFGVEVSEQDYLAGYGSGRWEWERLWGGLDRRR